MRLQTKLAAVSVVTLLAIAGGSSSASAQAAPQTQNNTANTTPAPVIVEVKPGDSLSKIATDHQTTYNRLFDANPEIQNPDVIHPGQKIRIPAANEQLAARALPAAPQPVAVAQPQKKATNQQPQVRKRTTARPAQPAQAAQVDGGVWDRLAQCESGGNWSINTGNGYSGGLQFSQSSWRGVGGSGLASQASKAEQIARAEALKARQGWGAWPACSAKLGLR